jgi:hypothetical protein
MIKSFLFWLSLQIERIGETPAGAAWLSGIH